MDQIQLHHNSPAGWMSCTLLAAIEPRIGHLKNDFRLGRNFLKGQKGDAINLLLAASESNLSLWMRRVLSALYYWLRFLLQNLVGRQKLAVSTPF
jgi:hypothetical protein